MLGDKFSLCSLHVSSLPVDLSPQMREAQSMNFARNIKSRTLKSCLAGLAVVCCGLSAHAQSQFDLRGGGAGLQLDPAPNAPVPAPAPSANVQDGSGVLNLSAVFGADARRIASGLVWNVFSEGVEGKSTLVAQSNEAAPIFVLPAGDYVVHVGYGLAGAVRRVTIEAGRQIADRVPLNAGGLRLVGTLGESRIPPERVSVSIYVPEGANPQGKLVAKDVRPAQLVRLPEGTYHVVSTYLEAATGGLSPAPTNSVVEADVRIQPGRTTEATLRHKAAQLTLKLVNAPGGEALANTSFTILTPGGDVIREMIGAFPSLVLAEGEYVAIARRDGGAYQGTFSVRSGRDRDVEIMARDPLRE